jgi:hypothetical protein
VSANLINIKFRSDLILGLASRGENPNTPKVLLLLNKWLDHLQIFIIASYSKDTWHDDTQVFELTYFSRSQRSNFEKCHNSNRTHHELNKDYVSDWYENILATGGAMTQTIHSVTMWSGRGGSRIFCREGPTSRRGSRNLASGVWQCADRNLDAPRCDFRPILTVQFCRKMIVLSCYARHGGSLTACWTIFLRSEILGK